MLLLNEKQRNLSACAAGLLGLALSLNVSYRVLNPEQVLSPEQVATMQWQQENNLYSFVDYGSKRYINALLLKSGAAIGLFALAYVLADPTPAKTFHPDPAKPVTIRQIEESDSEDVQKHVKKAKRSDREDEGVTRLVASAELQKEVAHKIGEWCAQWPWLLGMLRAPMVLVVGQPGSGKSSVMQAIALVRYLMFNCGVDIVDLDIDKNIRKKVWVHGVKHGSESRGAFSGQVNQLMSKLKDEMFPEKQGHSVLFDETSRWVLQEHMTYEEVVALMATAHQEWRRQEIKSIWGLHGLTVEENLGVKSCGKFTSVRDSAAILYMHPKNNALGMPEFSGIASFKPAGAPCGDVRRVMDNWQKVAIPSVFQSNYIIKMLGGLADDFDIGIKSPDRARERDIKAYVASSMSTSHGWGDRASESGDELADEFHAHVKTRVAEKVAIAWDEVDDIELVEAFHRKTMGRSARLEPDEKGVFRIREIWNSWAKHQDWSHLADFKEYLEELDEIGIGYADKYTWAWSDRADFPWLNN